MTSTEVVETQPLSATDARTLTDKIRTTLQFGHKLISEAFMGRAWVALGYESWDAYCGGEFTEARMIRLDREQRREIVADLRVQGMSTRAIGSALGVPQSTLGDDVRALSTDRNRSVEQPPTVTGLDGKVRVASTGGALVVDHETGEVLPAPRERAYAPRTDVVRAMSSALTRAREAAFAADEIKRDHLTNRSEEAATWGRSLSESMQSLQRLMDLLTEAQK